MFVCRLNSCRSFDDRREVDEAFVFELRASSSLASSCGLLVIAPKSAQVVSFSALTVRSGSALPSLHQNSQPISQGTYSASNFIAIEHDARRFHHIVADAVAGHPRDFVFGHRKPILSASAPPASG